MNNDLIIMGSAPCLEDDLSKIPQGTWGYMAIGLDAVDRYSGRIEYMATYHPADITEARFKRARARGNTTYKVISHEQKDGVDIVHPYKAPSGSSALLGVLAGIKLGYQKIILCGCPLEDEKKDGKNKNYQQFRKGWQAHLDEYIGKVRSMSGWTREFLGYPTDEWLAE